MCCLRLLSNMLTSHNVQVPHSSTSCVRPWTSTTCFASILAIRVWIVDIALFHSFS